MNAFDTYCAYLAIKMHFNQPDYDYFKYNGKVKANPESFRKRKDRIFFEKIAKVHNPIDFLVANFLADKNLYVRDIAYTKHAQERYTQYLKRKESLSYLFEQELGKLGDGFNAYILCEPNQHPQLIKLYLRDEISLETLCILVKLTGCLGYWDKRLGQDSIYQDVRFKITKYTPFLKLDLTKLKEIVKKRLTQVEG